MYAISKIGSVFSISFKWFKYLVTLSLEKVLNIHQILNPGSIDFVNDSRISLNIFGDR